MNENTSGQGKMAVVPAEISGWSWGAFLLTWIWGLGNSTYIALLMFVPGVNVVMWFVLGAKGNKWAWQNEKWESVEKFKVTQKKWAVWGIVLAGVSVLFGILVFSSLAILASHSTNTGDMGTGSSSGYVYNNNY